MEPSASRRPWLLGLVLVMVTAGVVVALVTSEESGTGARDVGDTLAEDAPAPDTEADSPADSSRDRGRPRRCEPTQSNPGGTNNYIPGARRQDSLGEGFVIRGTVRSAAGCRPLEGVRVQVWLATETGGEQDNRASVFTDADGAYRIETAPTIAQFGEPNIHVGYHDGDYGEVFIRRVVDLEDSRAVVDLTLAQRG